MGDGALRTLLGGIVDYAGLFPPASLSMSAAVRNYAEYRSGADAWMLGKFVVPSQRLPELVKARRESPERGHDRWPLSVLLGADVRGDLARAVELGESERRSFAVDSVEVKLTTAQSIAEAAHASPPGVALFVEVPIDHDPAPLIDAIRAAGASAKIRTGGTVADAFPPSNQIIRFIRRCIEAEVAFKATAGLHHPLRAEQALTYAADAPRGVMYGYLNVFLAAAFMRCGMKDDEAARLLDERDPATITIDRDAVMWRGRRLDGAALGQIRRSVAVSFGSCSFREPVDELATLGLSP